MEIISKLYLLLFVISESIGMRGFETERIIHNVKLDLILNPEYSNCQLNSVSNNGTMLLTLKYY